MSELSNSGHEKRFARQCKDVQVQEVPPFIGKPVDVDTATNTVLTLSPSDRITVIQNVYNSLEAPYLVSLEQDPYMQIRYRQARVSFRIVVTSVSFSITSCTVYTILLVTGTLPASFAVAGGIVTSASSAVSLYCYRLYKNANNRLDHAHSLYKTGDTYPQKAGEKHSETSH